MSAPLFDAHNHLAHSALGADRTAINRSLVEIGLHTAVVNGTQPCDWPQVLELAAQSPHVLPAIGLHPWYVNSAPEDWQTEFLNALANGARAIGEVGLDCWIEGHDLELQLVAFRWQVAQAQARNLPISIHCLKAMGPLIACLPQLELPPRGFHLHAYNGSVELIPQLVERGAYFSFNTGQLKPKAKKVRQAIQAVPADRLLIETDAPDMLPPPELREFELTTGDTVLNHPANLRQAYQAIADIRAIDFETQAAQVARNFQRFFLSQ